MKRSRSEHLAYRAQKKARKRIREAGRAAERAYEANLRLDAAGTPAGITEAMLEATRVEMEAAEAEKRALAAMANLAEIANEDPAARRSGLAEHMKGELEKARTQVQCTVTVVHYNLQSRGRSLAFLTGQFGHARRKGPAS